MGRRSCYRSTTGSGSSAGPGRTTTPWTWTSACAPSSGTPTRLYVHEVATKALYPVAEVGDRDDTFVAQPTWIGDRVVVTSYEDAVKSRRVKPKHQLWYGPSQEQSEDPTQGRGSSSKARPR